MQILRHLPNRARSRDLDFTVGSPPLHTHTHYEEKRCLGPGVCGTGPASSGLSFLRLSEQRKGEGEEKEESWVVVKGSQAQTNLVITRRKPTSGRLNRLGD